MMSPITREASPAFVGCLRRQVDDLDFSHLQHVCAAERTG